MLLSRSKIVKEDVLEKMLCSIYRFVMTRCLDRLAMK